MSAATIFFDLGDTLVFNNAAGMRQRFDDALDTLQILQQRGYRIGLLSNQAAGTTVAQVVTQLTSLHLARYVDAVLVTLSTEIAGNVGKPAQPIFDLALSKAGHAAASAQSIFVTEDAAHVLAARAFGWRAILLKRTGGPCAAADGECSPSLRGLLALLPALADLSGTQLPLAPPPKWVDGLWAVAMDISLINASLVFDAATQSATGDATLTFQMGRFTGCPFFDLRQTVNQVWLDGVALTAADVASHDFGGGAQAGLRVLARELDAGTVHTLRLRYDVGLPQASTAGSYLPQITWSAGPRLAFNFGFTDLGPGRYLEAFVPANLIYDQFELVLDLQLLGSALAHTPITNGTLTTLAANHWRINFAARYTALSPMLELRAADSLASAVHNEVLPVSGQNVAVTAWKLNSSAVDIAAQASAIGGFLSAHENFGGNYAHGNAYTALVHQGGMEYEGATTSSVGPLSHESFHSWWGRGVKPAGQPDGWFDEAWTVYRVSGGTAVLPLNFADAPVPLSPRNPWVRSTPIASYSAGERLWQGLAALFGAANLRDHMNTFYAKHVGGVVSTEQLEGHLLARTGRAEVVDAFHRFVYGLADPSPLPDLWLQDEPGHLGEEEWAGRFWDSPDLWVRNQEDDGLDHQNPEFGQDNWIYARVRNRSATATARHFMLSFNVKNYAGSQFAYPADFFPAVASAAGFDLGPGETRIVKARWPRALVPATNTHPCLLAAAFTRLDAPVAGRAVWQQNSLAQKNLTIVDMLPNRWFVLPFMVANLRPLLTRTMTLELVRPAKWPDMKASLIINKADLRPGLRKLATPIAAPADANADGRALQALSELDCGGPAHDGALAQDRADATALRDAPLTTAEGLALAFPKALELPFASGERASLQAQVGPGQAVRVGLRVSLPDNVKPGTRLQLDLVQRDGGKVVGGVSLRLNAAKL
jgi:hypothetical protein